MLEFLAVQAFRRVGVFFIQSVKSLAQNNSNVCDSGRGY